MNDLVLASRYTRERAYEVFDYLDVSEATRADYRTQIATFLNYLETNQLNRNSFLDFKRELATRTDISLSTKNKFLTTARIFLRELHRQGFLPTDITHNVRNFKQDSRHKQQGLSDEEIERLTGWFVTGGDSRDIAILCLLIFNGLREFEVVSLDWSNVNLKQGVAWIKGKGRDDFEPIYLNATTRGALLVHREIQQKSCENKLAGPVFRSRRRESADGRLTTRGLRRILKLAFAQTGIDKNVHGIRHFFVTRLLKEYDGNIPEVALYTRHRSWKSVQVYNDRIVQEDDLPRFFGAFSDIKLTSSLTSSD